MRINLFEIDCSDYGDQFVHFILWSTTQTDAKIVHRIVRRASERIDRLRRRGEIKWTEGEDLMIAAMEAEDLHVVCPQGVSFDSGGMHPSGIWSGPNCIEVPDDKDD